MCCLAESIPSGRDHYSAGDERLACYLRAWVFAIDLSLWTAGHNRSSDWEQNVMCQSRSQDFHCFYATVFYPSALHAQIAGLLLAYTALVQNCACIKCIDLLKPFWWHLRSKRFGTKILICFIIQIVWESEISGLTHLRCFCFSPKSTLPSGLIILGEMRETCIHSSSTVSWEKQTQITNH